MKQFKHKKLLALGGIGLSVLLLTSCTANFCSPIDQASMAYPYDQGATVYLTKAEYETLKAQDGTKEIIELEESWSADAQLLGIPSIAGPAYVAEDGTVLNDNVYKYVPFSSAGDALTLTANKTKDFLASMITSAANAGYSIPSVYYFALIDDLTLKAATTQFILGDAYEYSNSSEFEARIVSDANNKAKLATIVAGSDYTVTVADDYLAVNPYVEYDSADTFTEIPYDHSILRKYGNLKFTGHTILEGGAIDRPFLGHWKTWNAEIRDLTYLGFPLLTGFDVAGIDFQNYYINQITAKVNAVRSCIATRDGYFGHYGSRADWRVAIEQKDWGYAWRKGFLEGLLVYPVTWMLDSMAYAFDSSLSGAGQIWALIIVTLIVRGILLAVSWRTTLDNQKMQALQPEIAKLQQQYPNANTNQAEKARLSQKQMMLYKQHGIKPFRQFLVMIVQFPVFICVWAGLQGSAALSTGEVLNMRLSDNINTILFNVNGTWYANTYGWWTALVLFILMAATQIMAMLLPRILAKRAQKGVAKTGKSATANQQGNTMKWVSYGLIIFTIIMGFFLPSAMGIYWLIGGLISMTQTLITQAIMNKNRRRR